MMATGGAAVVSTADAVREVVGKQAIQIEPGDLDGWREALRRTIVDRDYLAAFRGRGMAHAAQFSWNEAARSTLAVYRRVLDQKPESISSRRAA